MNSTALMVAKATQFLFRNNEQKKRYTLLIIVLVTIGLCLVAGEMMQMSPSLVG